jgi:hypothetical protein
VAGVLHGKQSSTTKNRDFRESDLVGRSPKVAQRPFCAVPVLADFALRVKLPVRHHPPLGELFDRAGACRARLCWPGARFETVREWVFRVGDVAAEAGRSMR